MDVVGCYPACDGIHLPETVATGCFGRACHKPVGIYEGRLKLNGHLLEAGFRLTDVSRIGEDLAGYVDSALEQMIHDSEILRGLEVYEGPPDVFTSVPHAIHGLDLTIAGLSAARQTYLGLDGWVRNQNEWQRTHWK